MKIGKWKGWVFWFRPIPHSSSPTKKVFLPCHRKSCDGETAVALLVRECLDPIFERQLRQLCGKSWKQIWGSWTVGLEWSWSCCSDFCEVNGCFSCKYGLRDGEHFSCRSELIDEVASALSWWMILLFLVFAMLSPWKVIMLAFCPFE